MSLSAGFYVFKYFPAIFSYKIIPIFLACVVFFALPVMAYLTLKYSIISKSKFFVWFLLLSMIIFFICGLISNAADSYKLKNIPGGMQGIKKITDGINVTVEGRISSHINDFRGGILFFMKIETITSYDTGKNDYSGDDFNEEIMVIVRTRSSQLVKRDDLIRYRCRMETGQESIFLNGYDTGLQLIDRRPGFDLFSLRSRVYNCLKNSIYSSLDHRQASICEAVMLGNTYAIPENISSDFKKSGIYHLLAISGLHVSFFILVITKVIKFFTGRFKKNKSPALLQWMEIVSMIFMLLIYNFIIGQRASTLRATLMAFSVLLALYWRKEYNRKTVLSFSYIFLLIIDPGFFSDPGFWLSFLSVFGIVYTRDLLIRFFGDLKKKIIEIGKKEYNIKDREKISLKTYFFSSFATVFSINITVLPVLLYLFGESPAMSLFTNIIAIPVFYSLLFILFVASAAILIWPPYGQFLLNAVRAPVYILLKISTSWRYIGFSTIKSNNFETIHLLIYYIIMLFVLFIISRSLAIKERIKR